MISVLRLFVRKLH